MCDRHLHETHIDVFLDLIGPAIRLLANSRDASELLCDTSVFGVAKPMDLDVGIGTSLGRTSGMLYLGHFNPSHPSDNVVIFTSKGVNLRSQALFQRPGRHLFQALLLHQLALPMSHWQKPNIL